MTGLLRNLGLSLVFVALAAPAATAQDLKTSFDEGVALLRRDRDDEALSVFQKMLASAPDQTAAYDLWSSTDSEDWIDLLTRGGEYELFAKHMMELVKLGHKERQDNPDAIRGHVQTVASGASSADARQAKYKLAADHGEFAVAYMVPYLADPADDDPRIRVMTSLAKDLGSEAVLPLIEALNTNDAFLRRNVVSTLGQIGDARALPALTLLAQNDADGGVQQAAQGAVSRIGGDGSNALTLYIRQGDDYHHGRDTVLRDYHISNVVWEWTGVRLEPRGVRIELYGDELAKRSFSRALEIDPSSSEAYAGLVRSWVAQDARVAELADLGEDIGDLATWTGEGQIAVNLAGVDAVDTALSSAVQHGEARTAVALCRTLGRMSSRPTNGLRAALSSGESVMRAEAAVALARIAMESDTQVFAGTVEALAEAVRRDVQRIAAVIDSNKARAQGLVSALRAAGYYAYSWGSGAKGLARIKRVPGVDVVFVGDMIKDLTPFQVIDSLKSDTRFADTPVVLLATDADAAGELFDDKVDAIMVEPVDIGAVASVLSDGLNRDRAQAITLATQAAIALAQLSRSGHDVSSALGSLTGALSGGRPDALTIPAMEAIAAHGGEAALPALTSVVADSGHSDQARWAAARACAGIFRRGGQPSGEETEVLFGIVKSDAALEVRTAVAYALGNLDLDPVRRSQAVISQEAATSE